MESSKTAPYSKPFVLYAPLSTLNYVFTLLTNLEDLTKNIVVVLRKENFRISLSAERGLEI